MAGAKLKVWHAVRAKKRMPATLKKGAAPARANLPQRAEGKARDHAAKAVGVSGYAGGSKTTRPSGSASSVRSFASQAAMACFRSGK